jgi:mannose-6-phosphate isomerase-like protein (cupin superfamily)
MHLIGRAGTYTPPEGGESNHWIVHMNSDALSLGTYSIPAGGTDDQEPHTEDEVYVVQAGRATLVTASGTVPVEPGSVVFVPADETHKFTDITEDLALVVIFAPRYGSRTPPLRLSGRHGS